MKKAYKENKKFFIIFIILRSSNLSYTLTTRAL